MTGVPKLYVRKDGVEVELEYGDDLDSGEWTITYNNPRATHSDIPTKYNVYPHNNEEFYIEIKYQEGIEVNYVPFRMIMDANNGEIIQSVFDILFKAATYFEYITPKKSKEFSFYKLEKGLDFSECGFITFKHVDGLSLEDDTKQKKIIYELEELLCQSDKIFVILCGNTYEIEQFFLGREDFRNKYFEFVIKGINPSVQDIYDYVLEHVDVKNDFKVRVLDYISGTYDGDGDYVKYQNDLVQYISFCSVG